MKFEITFEMEKETKNTVKYAEVPKKGEPARVGTLYLQKWTLPTPYPEHVTITVEGPGE